MGQNILVVEDDLDTLELLADYFKRYGYNVVTATFGEDAVAISTASSPDLIILDIRLPDIDGYEVCRRLGTRQRTANVPIIFLTEKRERDSRIAGLQLGAVDYISKPFDIHELRLRVENALRRAGFRPLNHPVTALPGDRLLSEYLDSLRGKRGWALTRVDLEGLDEFDARYGFVARDDMLRAVAMSIQTVADESVDPAGFAAHLEAASFCLITSVETAHDLEGILRDRLQHIITRFYPMKDVEAGNAERQPLPTIQIYVSTVGEDGVPVEKLSEILEAAYEARRRIACVPSE